MASGPSFHCPACNAHLQVPDYYLILTMAGVIVVPALIFWALGFSWLQLILAELLVVYPIFWLAARFGMYVIPPKIEVYSPVETGGTELHLRDRPRR
jgi:hypothetical protein